MDTNRDIIFYGGGRYCGVKLAEFEAKGIFPKCIADRDTNKQNTVYVDHFGNSTAYHIFSLEDAISQYPNYQLFVSMIPDNLLEVTEYLLREGVPEERISYTDDVRKGWGCAHIGSNCIKLESDTIQICLSPFQKDGLQIQVDFNQPVENLMMNVSELAKNRFEELISGKSTSCDGCYHREYRFWETYADKDIRLAIGWSENSVRCNSKCVYCKDFGKWDAELTARRVDYFIRLYEYLVDKQGAVFLALTNGEPTLSMTDNQLDKILCNEKNKSVRVIGTSGIAYFPKIEELCKNPLNYLFCGLDAGTPETFYKIKQIDKFHQVLSNLKAYAENACTKITLHYVVCDGINTGDKDIVGFVEVCRSMPIRYVILYARCDYVNKFTPDPLSDETYSAFYRMMHECSKYDIEVLLAYETLSPDDGKRLTNYQEELKKASWRTEK